MIKLILFDFDGTIANTSALFYDAAQHFSNKYDLGEIKKVSYYKNIIMKIFLRRNLK